MNIKMKADVKGLDKDKQKPNLEVKTQKAVEKPKEVKVEVAQQHNPNALHNNNPQPISSPREKTQEEEIVKNKEPSTSPVSSGKTISKKTLLDEKEIIEPPVDIFLPKKSNPNFICGILNKKISDSKFDEEIFNGVKLSLSNMTAKVANEILNNSIEVGAEKKSVKDIILQKEASRKVKIEEIIRQQKIKEIQENKESIGHKIKSLEENIKLLELDGGVNISRVDLNTSLMRGDVDDNIRKSRIKEIKSTKELLEKKLTTLDEQVQKLMTEEELTNHKKFNLKQFLDNFEKDKSEVAAKTKKWEAEQKERIRHLMEAEEKAKEKLKKKEADTHNLIKLKEKEREETYRKKLEKKKEKDRIHHEHLEKIKEEWKNRASINQEYAFQRFEKEFIEKQNKEMEEKKHDEFNKLQERKNMLRPINREEINEFSKKVIEERQKKIYEKEKERITKFEEIQSKNEQRPKPETVSYQKAIEEAKLQKENKEKEKLDKIYKNMKVKQFSKVIKTELLPRIDEKKKKEIEERVEKMRSRSKVEKLSHNRKGRILLKKPDPNKPKKYKWDLKLNTSDENLEKRKSRSKSAKSFSESLAKSKLQSDLLDEDVIEREIKQRLSKSRSGEKRKPMEKHPDYLTEMRIKKIQMNSSSNTTVNKEKKSDRKWHKMINNGKYSLIENVEQIKIKANMLEEQAKMKEKFLHLNGGSEKNPELGEDVSNMLIDAIKAKLTILENISKKK